MGHLIKNKPKLSSKRFSKNITDISRGASIVHKARVLTAADVQANRSAAYSYLSL